MKRNYFVNVKSMSFITEEEFPPAAFYNKDIFTQSNAPKE